jgi:hypothetical protein
MQVEFEFDTAEHAEAFAETACISMIRTHRVVRLIGNETRMDRAREIAKALGGVKIAPAKKGG